MIAPSPETPAVMALGEAMVEFNQARADAPESYVRGYRGDTSNMVIAAARLGVRAARILRMTTFECAADRIRVSAAGKVAISWLMASRRGDHACSSKR
jgi:hypothetical protein